MALQLSGSLDVSGSLIVNGEELLPINSSSFLTTGSNTFDGTQTVNGNLFMSGAFRLVYNDDPENNLLFGLFDGSTIHGPYYQLFGNQYSSLSQRGGAEFVYDVRNNADANFHVASFNGSSWDQKFVVNDTGIQVTGSVQATQGFTGSLYGTSSWTENFRGTIDWWDNQTGSFLPNEQITVSNDFVLDTSMLTLMKDPSNKQYTIGNKTFRKRAKIFMGGDLLLVDSQIVNDGEINVQGGVILSGNSSIVGTGILT